ncbi:MAG: hypothetical protein ABI838_08490 [Chloroflexota bacterium]
MTTWRLPTRDEQLADFVRLSRFLTPRIAASIAAMPIVVLDPESTAPLSLRVDAWCHRVDRLLAQRATDERRAAA